jgi:hypothetical protein
VAQSLPEGGDVEPAYYNPANPQETCLEREAPCSNLLLIIVLVLPAIFLCICRSVGTTVLNYIKVEYLL